MFVLLAYGGAKMVVFGGRFGGSISGSIYILDVASMTWSEGQSSQPRTGMVCSVSGDYFIAWGGTAFTFHCSISITLQNTLHAKYIFFCRSSLTFSCLLLLLCAQEYRRTSLTSLCCCQRPLSFTTSKWDSGRQCL